MSQAGEIDVIGNNPEIPTSFVTDDGIAVPIANVLEILGTSVAAGSIPVETTGSGNTVTIEVQTSQAIAATDATKIGLSAFNSSEFTVDANGFVSLVGGGMAVDSIAVQTGTSPIVPTGAGLVTINGAVVAAGTHPIRTDGTGANTMAVEVQISQALAATDATKIGLSNFDSAAFDVDANGFVQLNGGGIAATAFDVQANTAPGTDPVVPSASGVVIVNGAAVANHSVVLETRSRAANAYNLEIQYATSAAATDATKSGVAHFNSTQFSVDANGFVALAGGGLAIDSIHPDSGTDPVVPNAAGLVNIVGSGSTTTVGSLNTLTVQLTGLTNHAILVGAGTTTITKVGPSATAGQIFQSGGAAADPLFSTATYPSTATGTGKVLVADGTNWVPSTPTFPNASATSGKIIQSDGTNWVASTPTYPLTAGTSGKILISDGTNIVSSTPTYPNSATGTGTILRADGTNWVATTSTYPNTNAVNTLLYASSANVMAALATANGGVLTTDSSGVPSIDTTNFSRLTTGMQMKGNNTNTAPPAGFIGEQIRSAIAIASKVSLVTATAKSVTSISLTAGIWDVSCLCAFNITAGTASVTNVSISTTDNTNGTQGDNMCESNSVPVSGVTNSAITVPAYRLTLSGTTTVYMVAQMTFTSAGNGFAYGRISGTRVG